MPNKRLAFLTLIDFFGTMNSIIFAWISAEIPLTACLRILRCFLLLFYIVWAIWTFAFVFPLFFAYFPLVMVL